MYCFNGMRIVLMSFCIVVLLVNMRVCRLYNKLIYFSQMCCTVSKLRMRSLQIFDINLTLTPTVTGKLEALYSNNDAFAQCSRWPCEKLDFQSTSICAMKFGKSKAARK